MKKGIAILCLALSLCQPGLFAGTKTAPAAVFAAETAETSAAAGESAAEPPENAETPETAETAGESAAEPPENAEMPETAETAGEAAFSLYARSAVLMDADSGRVLFEKDGYSHMPNASTTKILTCILAIESGRMEEVATASAYAASMPKVHLGMKQGEQFVLRDLLFSLMLESHNDSAVVIAEHIGTTVEGFAAMMNQKARELGCTDTYFITPNGLDASDEKGSHGTSARDLALIMSYCLKNETFLEITRTPSYSFSNLEGTKQYSCNNHNTFLSMMEGALTGKTGFTGSAGYCYVGALRQGERTFVVALLACGWPNNKSYKWSDTKELMNYALANYQYEEVFEHGKEFSPVPVKNAMPTSWTLGQEVSVLPRIEDAQLKVLKNASEEIRTVYEIPRELTAPLQAGQEIGTVCYYLGDQELARYPVKILEDVAEFESSWYFSYVLQEFFLWKEQ